MGQWIQIFTSILRQIKCKSDISHCDVMERNEKGENVVRKEGLALWTHTHV
jgi:hypothetical protein